MTRKIRGTFEHKRLVLVVLVVVVVGCGVVVGSCWFVVGWLVVSRLRAIGLDRTAILFFERASKNCILLHFPSVFGHRDSGFVQIVLNFFQILIGIHRVHGCEKH